jgi:hypothetical protein
MIVLLVLILSLSTPILNLYACPTCVAEVKETTAPFFSEEFSTNEGLKE